LNRNSPRPEGRPPPYPEIDDQKKPPSAEQVASQTKMYEVAQSIQVTINDLPRVGNVLDKIVQAGVNQIDYIGFSFKDTTYDSLRAQAYKRAVEDARGQADAIVGAMGGFIIGIASASTNYWGPIYAMEKRDVSGGTVPPSTPVVPQGSITVTAQINIVYLYL